MPYPILFVDRDGTLVQEPHDYKVDSLEKIALVPEVIPALLRLKHAGYHFIMVSNQDGLGGNGYPRPSFDDAHAFILDLFASQGLTFDYVMICPHFIEELCSCRKPDARHMLAYLKTTDWLPERSAMVGDRETDLTFATNLGVHGFRIDSPFAPALTWFEIADKVLAL